MHDCYIEDKKIDLFYWVLSYTNFDLQFSQTTIVMDLEPTGRTIFTVPLLRQPSESHISLYPFSVWGKLLFKSHAPLN